VQVLDYYIDNFVWGGLQKTDEEEYSYGIYGIPDWHTLRKSEDTGAKGKRHIWRIYDYPHIGLMYYNMYKIARDYPHIIMQHSKLVYIERAYRTFLAMFMIPEEIEAWSAYKTGLYNELVMVEVFEELYKLGQDEKALRLEAQWARKARSFVNGSQKLFNSEYPFDSTGFESTHALAKYALSNTTTKDKVENDDVGFMQGKAAKFMELQLKGNLFCRGILEKAYYLYGSDYRDSSTAAYTLSYMAQMGGWAVLDYALNYADDTNDLLPLGYASYLSSWALMNTGTAESDYGYWYPGIENDGSAGGGFEPSPYGETWLEQPHHRGSWYYSCEIDLGFLGALRSARTIIAKDPDFGMVCYGGTFNENNESYTIKPNDGLNKRFTAVIDDHNISIDIEGARYAENSSIVVLKDFDMIEFDLFTESENGNHITVNIKSKSQKSYDLFVDGNMLCSFNSECKKDIKLDKQLSNIVIKRKE